MYLHDDECFCAADLGEWNGNSWVSDCLPFLQLVLDVLEGSSAVDHLVEDAAEGPNVTGSTNLRCHKHIYIRR